jgi:uridylate kinase
MNYKKILLKLSGEALYNKEVGIICPNKLRSFAEEVKSVYDMGVKISIVMGGGNILRGEASKQLGITRFKLDNMGMLATVINSIAIQDYLEKQGINAVVLSSIEMNKICDFYTAQKTIELMNQNKVVVFAGGIANPYFSTDTCAVLRGVEIDADLVLKGTQVDGVYNKDPRKHDDATKIKNISYDEVINQKLQIMDLSSILLAQKANIPIGIFNIHTKGNLKAALIGDASMSIIH